MGTRGRWLVLLAASGGLALGVAGLHRWSGSLSGPAGDLVRNSLARDLSVYAYVYTDVGDPAEFLERGGRYGGLVRDTATGPEPVGREPVGPDPASPDPTSPGSASPEPAAAEAVGSQLDEEPNIRRRP